MQKSCNLNNFWLNLPRLNELYLHIWGNSATFCYFALPNLFIISLPGSMAHYINALRNRNGLANLMWSSFFDFGTRILWDGFTFQAWNLNRFLDGYFFTLLPWKVLAFFDRYFSTFHRFNLATYWSLRYTIRVIGNFQFISTSEINCKIISASHVIAKRYVQTQLG